MVNGQLRGLGTTVFCTYVLSVRLSESESKRLKEASCFSQRVLQWALQSFACQTANVNFVTRTLILPREQEQQHAFRIIYLGKSKKIFIKLEWKFSH